MAMFTQSISVADVLSGLTTDDTKWAGANIANLDDAITTAIATTQLNKRRVYLTENHTFDASADTDINLPVDTAPLLSGTWYVKYQYTTAGNSKDQTNLYLLYEDGNNYLVLRAIDADSADTPELKKCVVGAVTSLINGGNTTDTSEHTMSVTRSGVGDYELFYDGTTQGTASDLDLPDATESRLGFFDSAGNSVIVMKDAYYQGD